jgi:hypothetical protein
MNIINLRFLGNAGKIQDFDISTDQILFLKPIKNRNIEIFYLLYLV